MRGEAWSCALCWDMMSGVSPEPGAYVARYGWNGRSGGLIIGAAVFVLIAVTAPMSLALRVVTLVLFGGGALVFIAIIERVTRSRRSPAAEHGEQNGSDTPLAPARRVGDRARAGASSYRGAGWS